MLRVPLKQGEVIKLNNKKYTINEVLGDGATCIVYSARYTDKAGFSHNVNIKECYPYNIEIMREGQKLVWANAVEKERTLSSFQNTYKKLISFQNDNFVVHVFDICENNGTQYIIMDTNKGQTFDKINYDNLSSILKIIKLLSYVVGEYHKNGYLHLDIKPSNFLVYPKPSEHIVLFDLDTITAIDDIDTGKIKNVSYSDSWAAPEQKQGNIAKVCPATDIFAIGAILFEKIFGRQVQSFDMGIFADWDFENNLLNTINPKIKRILRNIFRKTLAANVKRRYQNTDELLIDLDEAIKTANQEKYLISDNIISEINFVGREVDLQKIDELFDDGAKAVFLHGFGGVGKTELARKYAELNANKYDCIKFCKYSNGLSQIIDGFEIANITSEEENGHRKQLKSVLKDSKNLIIIDNFDVDDDDDLEDILELNCNILFTTRNDFSEYFSGEKIEIIDLETMPTPALVQIFKNEFGRSVTEEEEDYIIEIIEKFDNITMIVPMIAKQIIASHISIEEFSDSVDDDIFARFNEDIRIRKDGKSQKTNSLNYLRAMFNISALPDDYVTTLQYLYLLRRHNALTIETYQKYTDTKNLNILNDLAFRNWITIDETEITVHQLIYDLIEKDYYPNYEEVPGITRYIEDCFGIIETMIKQPNSEDENIIDWEVAKCITFALLTYDDIRKSEDKDMVAQKMGILFHFMCIAFLEDPSKLYSLLFESPQESDWHFFVEGIMCMFNLKIKSAITTWSDVIFLLKNSIANNDQLAFYHPTTGKFIAEFPTKKEKLEFIEFIKEDLGLSAGKTLAEYCFITSYCVMLLYFANAAGKGVICDNTITIIENNEAIIQNAAHIFKELESTDSSDYTSLLNFRLNFYLSICKLPQFSKNGDEQGHKGLRLKSYYSYYVFVLSVLKHALSMKLDRETQEKYLNAAENIIILLEEANGLFSWYGMSEQKILTFEPASIEEVERNRKVHWSKKANRWYNSFISIVEKTENPFPIYKTILKCDGIDIARGISTIVSSKSKYNVLIKHGFVDRMFNDNRLTLEEKKSLLYDFVSKEVYLLLSEKSIMKTLVRKNSAILEIYFDILSRVEFFDPDFYKSSLSEQKILILNNIFTLRHYLKKDIPHINSYIENCINAENIEYLGHLFCFVDKIRRQGYIKKSQELKHKILDLCSSEDLSVLSEPQIQFILYKLTPFAKKHNKQNVLEKIGLAENNISREYYLELLYPDNILINLSEQISIACRFLDDYIESVAIEAYNKIHNGLPDKSLDEMEQLLIKYLDSLLLVAELSEHNYYNPIFGDKTAFNTTIKDGFIRQLCPFWVSQFYCFYNSKVDMGICYLIAETYKHIPYEKGKLSCALEAVLENDGSENDYTLSQEEINNFLDNIVKICPEAKNDIERYFENNSL